MSCYPVAVPDLRLSPTAPSQASDTDTIILAVTLNQDRMNFAKAIFYSNPNSGRLNILQYDIEYFKA